MQHPRAMSEPSPVIEAIRIGEDPSEMQNGLAKLVLVLVEVVRQVLEKQALRRVESGTLTEDEVERLGLAFMQLNSKLAELSSEFGIKPAELKSGLGALLHVGNRELDGASLADAIDRLLQKGVVVAGKVRISVADIDLVGLDLFATLYPILGKTVPARRG